MNVDLSYSDDDSGGDEVFESGEDSSDEDLVAVEAAGSRRVSVQIVLTIQVALAILMGMISAIVLQDQAPWVLLFLAGVALAFVDVLYFSVLFFVRRVPARLTIDGEMGVVTLVFHPIAGISFLGSRKLLIPLDDAAFALRNVGVGAVSVGKQRYCRCMRSKPRLCILTRDGRTFQIDYSPELTGRLKSAVLHRRRNFDWESRKGGFPLARGDY